MSDDRRGIEVYIDPREYRELVSHKEEARSYELTVNAFRQGLDDISARIRLTSHGDAVEEEGARSTARRSADGRRGLADAVEQRGRCCATTKAGHRCKRAVAYHDPGKRLGLCGIHEPS